MSTPSQRLREERKRLGYNQTDFGALGGVRKQAQIKYEAGLRRPDASYLLGIAKAGADVRYIITGDRRDLCEALNDIQTAADAAALIGGTHDQVAESQGQIYNALRDAHVGTVEERQLLDDYRRCDADDQAVIRKMAASLAQPPHKKKSRKP